MMIIEFSYSKHSIQCLKQIKTASDVVCETQIEEKRSWFKYNFSTGKYTPACSC